MGAGPGDDRNPGFLIPRPACFHHTGWVPGEGLFHREMGCQNPSGSLARLWPRCRPTSPGACPNETQIRVETSVQSDRLSGQTCWHPPRHRGPARRLGFLPSVAAPPAPGFPIWPSKPNVSSK